MVDSVEEMQDRIRVLEDRLKTLMRVATDRKYMLLAYRNMLGEQGAKVARMWDEKGVKRVHFDWEPEAYKMTGEERAAFILSIEGMPMKLIDKFDED